MPGVNPSNDRWLATTIKNILQRLTNLEGQQNGGVRNAQNQLRLQLGLLPDGTYGLVAYDNAGNKRAQLGQLPDGDFGFATYSPANNGSYVELNVPQASPSSGTISTASTSFTTIAGSPTLTVACGASGTMLITLSGTLGLPSIANATVQSFAKVYVDGVLTGPGLGTSLQTTTTPAVVGLQTTGAATALVTGLTQGSHTLSIEYQSVFGQLCNFTAMQIICQPY